MKAEPKMNQEWENKEENYVLVSVLAVDQCRDLGLEEAVHFLQLLLGKHEAVHLFLSRDARNGNTANEQRSSLLLFLGLGNTFLC